MKISTKLNELLKVEHPIMLAGMAGVAYSEVCAAVSNAGGYGTLGAANMSVKEISDEAKKVRELTDKPFGIDLLSPVPDQLEKGVDAIIDSGASSFIAGLGVPFPIIEKLHNAGLLVISMCGTVNHAIKAEEAGCDIVVAQGTEAGGHTGKIGGMALIPQVVDAVKIPVVAAGSIIDGRGLAAALAFGAVGVWVGTRFIMSNEAHAHQDAKDHMLNSGIEDTIVTKSYTGKPCRCIKNDRIEKYENDPSLIQKFPMQFMKTMQDNVFGTIGGKIQNINVNEDCMPSGQGIGGISDILPAKQIVDDMVHQASNILEGTNHFSIN